MKQKKDFSWIYLPVCIGAILLFAIYDCSMSAYIKKTGEPKTVTVVFHETVSLKGRAPQARSCGYYYVNNKQYKAFINGIFPIGTKFEIKYYPKRPSRWERTTDIIQE